MGTVILRWPLLVENMRLIAGYGIRVGDGNGSYGDGFGGGGYIGGLYGDGYYGDDGDGFCDEEYEDGSSGEENLNGNG